MNRNTGKKNALPCLVCILSLFRLLVVSSGVTGSKAMGKMRVVNTESYRKPVCTTCYLSNYMLRNCLSVQGQIQDFGRGFVSGKGDMFYDII